MMTSVMATATTRIGAACLTTLRILPSVRNVSVVAEKNTKQAKKNTAMDSTWACSEIKSATGDPAARSV
ncbi:hypothetical protein D3C87_2138300 [compost metagenome]